MPRARQLSLAALVAVASISCARVPARGPQDAPTSSAGSDPASAAKREEEAAPEATNGERPRAPAPSAPEPGDALRADRQPPTPAAVRDAVGAVASARRSPSYGTPHALLTIAGMLERVTDGHSAAASALVEMRRAIEALERTGSIDLDRADHVKEALERGVAAIESFAQATGAKWLDPWVDSARAAEGVIDRATPLGLQRAAVQDALRSLADAVLIAEQFADR